MHEFELSCQKQSSSKKIDTSTVYYSVTSTYLQVPFALCLRLERLCGVGNPLCTERAELMAGIKIHVKSNNRERCTINNLLIISAEKKLKITSVKQVNNNFNIYCPSFEECEKVFVGETLTRLQGSGFDPILPGVLKAARTVIMHRVQDEITAHDETTIKQEIINCNTWGIVKEVYKFKSLLKIVFQIAAMADKCLQLGLSLFYLHIPAIK